MFKKLCSLFLTAIVSAASAKAQYTINNPIYEKQESYDITLNAVRLFPDSMVIDLGYTARRYAKDPGFYVNNTTKIEFGYGGQRLYADWHSTVSQLVNANYSTILYVKKGSTHNFSVVFPFSIYKMFGRKDVPVQRLQEFFAVPDPFSINFINCDANYRSAYNLSYGICFDIYRINLQMPLQEWAVLWCKGFLKEYFVKDEFETSAKYLERTSKENIRLALQGEIKKVNNLLAYSYISTIANTPPQIQYNSDSETFSIKYSGADEMSVAMPIAAAKAFKQNIVDRTYKIDDVDFVTYPDGSHYFGSISYIDNSGKKITIRNRLSSRGNLSSVYDEVISRLRQTYPGL